jgi:hypothetical protein
MRRICSEFATPTPLGNNPIKLLQFLSRGFIINLITNLWFFCRVTLRDLLQTSLACSLPNSLKSNTLFAKRLVVVA